MIYKIGRASGSGAGLLSPSAAVRKTKPAHSPYEKNFSGTPLREVCGFDILYTRSSEKATWSLKTEQMRCVFWKRHGTVDVCVRAYKRIYKIQNSNISIESLILAQNERW